MRVQSLGREDPLEKEVATYSSILACKNPMNRGAQQDMVCGITELDITEQLDMHAHIHTKPHICAFWFMDLPLFPCNKIIFNAIVSIKCSLHPHPKGLITTCLVIPI